MSLPVIKLFDEDWPTFHCPGCGLRHCVNTDPEREGPHWQWNGSLDKPTITPSILVRWEYAGRRYVCHSFVTDGSIQFLGDSTHSLAGKTVPLYPEQ